MKSWLLSLLLVVLVSRCVEASVAITTSSVPNGTVKTAYAAVIQAGGGCTPYKWTIVSGALPAGITAKVPSTTTSLNLAGTPTTAATYSFAVKVTGCGGGISQMSYKVVIQAPPSGVAITTSSVPNGMVKTTYSAVIKASGGCTPYKWTIASGALPAGVTATVPSTTTSLSLAGTPTTAATYPFAVKVTGCGGGVSQVSYKVVIQATANHVVDLSWNASTSSNVVGYNVYRSPDGATWKKVNASLIASTLYSDSTVANGTTYYYAAAAVDVSGHESIKTAPVKAVVP
jgi:hypothetical protein